MRRIALSLCALILACRPGIAGFDDEVGGESSSAGEASDASEGATLEGVSESETSSNECAEVWLSSEFIAPKLLISIDASSSMALATWDDDGDPLSPEVTRWSSARRIVKQVVDALGPTVDLGVQRFPSAAACPNAGLDAANCSDADVCLVDAAPEVAVGPATGPAIFASLPGSSADATLIAGASPTRAAFEVARAHLLALEPSYKYILLLTDGGANCGQGLSLPATYETYDDDLLSAVSDAFALDGIATIVLGVDVAAGPSVAGEDQPVVDAFAALNELALAGGMPQLQGSDPQKFFDAADPQALIDAITSIDGGSETSCVIDLSQTEAGPPAPEVVPYVYVEVDGLTAPRVDDCADQNGWAWIVEGEVLSLCGYYCDEFKVAADVYIRYGCGENAG